jgi:hypothetical protein
MTATKTEERIAAKKPACMTATRKAMCMTGAEFEAETLRRALAGDHEAGREALRLCIEGLGGGPLSRALAEYLAQRLGEIDQALDEADRLKEYIASPSTLRSRKAVLIERALLIAKETKPRDPIPDWQTPLAAFGTILLLAGLRRERVYTAMSEARTMYEGGDPKTGKTKTLDRSEAYKILKTFEPMCSIPEDTLMYLAGPLRELVPQFLPQT